MTNTHSKKGMGYKKSSYDPRDYMIKRTKSAFTNLPSHYDSISKHIPEVTDQGETSSCTLHASVMAMRYERIIHKLKDERLSRMFGYYMVRLLENDVDKDDGAEIRDVFKVLNTYGLPPESEWAFEMDNLYKQPPQNVMTDAKNIKASMYYNVKQTLNDFKACMFEGYPVVFGTDLYDAFESDAVAKSGLVPLPNWKDTPIGGHALLCVGYDDSKKLFKVLNSWSDTWGDHGYCYFPYDYLMNPDHTSDVWTLRMSSDVPKKSSVVQPELKNKKVVLTS